jgi:hypothetical protein
LVLPKDLSYFFSHATPAEYGVMGIGGGFWLLSTSITLWVKRQYEP